MLDRFKEFIGIDDNYDDYDEEQMYYDDEDSEDTVEEKPKNNSYSSLFDDEDSYKNEDTFSQSNFTDDFSGGKTYGDTYRSKTNDSKLVSMNSNDFTGSSNMRISIQEPLDYDNDGPVVIEEILKNKVVVLNLEMVDSDLRMRIFDFVSGAVYALKGNMKKVTKGIFVITPNGVEIDSFVADQISEGNYNQL